MAWVEKCHTPPSMFSSLPWGLEACKPHSLPVGSVSVLREGDGTSGGGREPSFRMAFFGYNCLLLHAPWAPPHLFPLVLPVFLPLPYPAPSIRSLSPKPPQRFHFPAWVLIQAIILTKLTPFWTGGPCLLAFILLASRFSLTTLSTLPLMIKNH